MSLFYYKIKIDIFMLKFKNKVVKSIPKNKIRRKSSEPKSGL